MLFQHLGQKVTAQKVADAIGTTPMFGARGGETCQIKHVMAKMTLGILQKIKTPGVRITDAAKAMKCEFRVALTGTPVENRLADLWCIMDGVHPGLLDDLKTFSLSYERDLDTDKLRRLKSTLERPLGGRPPIMLRRLKEDRLPELPEASVRAVKREMPAAQRDAYEVALAAARGADRPGAMLEALQKLRAVSLHPNPEASNPDDAFIAYSARLSVAMEALDEIAATNEKALIFLEDLDLQRSSPAFSSAASA